MKTKRFEYAQYAWGDMLRGAKEDIQSFGIAIGLAFPGESGGPARYLSVIDPTGCQVRIERWDRSMPAVFAARRTFHDWPEPPHCSRNSTTYAPGVKLFKGVAFDEYSGAAEALVAAGLVLDEQLPGRPGMRKTRVNILADGSVAGGETTANVRYQTQPRVKHIERASPSRYIVHVHVGNEERELRRAVASRAEIEWQRRIGLLRRPAPLREIEPRLLAAWHASARAAREDQAFQRMFGHLVRSQLAKGQE